MTYLQHRNTRAQQTRKTVLTVFFCAVLVIAGVHYFAPSVFPGLFMSIARPFWQMQFSVESGALRSPGQLLSENESLKRRLADMQALYASSSVDLLIRENEEFRIQMGRASSSPQILAAVLARPPVAAYDELILDIGADKGIGSTTRVFGPNNLLIGRVAQVYAKTSKVLLFTSPGQTYSILVGSSHIPATAIGQGGGQYRAEVPHGAAVSIGDAVSDASLKNGAFGTVVSVETDPSNPFDSIYITPSVNPYQLRWVYLDARI